MCHGLHITHVVYVNRTCRRRQSDWPTVHGRRHGMQRSRRHWGRASRMRRQRIHYIVAKSITWRKLSTTCMHNKAFCRNGNTLHCIAELHWSMAGACRAGWAECEACVDADTWVQKADFLAARLSCSYVACSAVGVMYQSYGVRLSFMDIVRCIASQQFALFAWGVASEAGRPRDRRHGGWHTFSCEITQLLAGNIVLYCTYSCSTQLLVFEEPTFLVF